MKNSSNYKNYKIHNKHKSMYKINLKMPNQIQILQRNHKIIMHSKKMTHTNLRENLVVI